MLYVSVDPIPNQRFTFVSNLLQLVFTLRSFRGMTYVSVDSSDGENIVESERVCNNGWILPERMNATGGNFRFEDENNEYPDYRNFNATCFLKWYSKDEIDGIRNGVSG